MDESDEINLEEIVNMSEKKFKKHLSKWLLDKDISKDLQAKLRKELIENFATTRLGRKIAAHHNRSQQLLLSPLNLILNSLVAEFLYAQNCHYSLSVFYAETPYEKTLPDLEKCENFRFTKDDIVEILDAVAAQSHLPLDNKIKENILNKYMQTEKSHKDNHISCLHAIFQTVFGQKFHQPVIENTDSKLSNLECKTNFKTRSSQKQNSKKKKSLRNFRFLKKYLILFTNKIKEISMFIYKLEKKNLKNSSVSKSEISCKLEQFNEKLDKISKLIAMLSFSDKKSSKGSTSSVVDAIERMSQQFNTCSKHFESILQNNVLLNSSNIKEEKTYRQWIYDIKNTKSGKEFMAKIESAIQKVLGKEKNRMFDIFKEKFENEKQLLKLKYKQRYFEHLSKLNLIQEKDKVDNSKRIEHQIMELKQKYEDVKKFSFNKNNENNSNNELNNQQFRMIVADNKKNKTLLTESRGIQCNTGGNNLVQNSSKQIHDIAKEIAEQELSIDSIVLEAKLRIKELEMEGNQIEKNFQDYLSKQNKTKSDFENNIESILEKYNSEKTILNNKCKIFQEQIDKQKSLEKQKEINTILHNVPKIRIELQPNELEILEKEKKNILKEFEEYENPFRKLQSKDLRNILKDQDKNYQKLSQNLNEPKLETPKKFLSTVYPNVLDRNLEETMKKKKSEQIQNCSEIKTLNASKDVKSSEPKSPKILKTNLLDKIEIDSKNVTLNTSINTMSNESIKENYVIDSAISSSQISYDETFEDDKSIQILNDFQKSSSSSINSKNIFQISSYTKDEEINRILESPKTSFNDKKQNNKLISPTYSQKENEISPKIEFLLNRSNSYNSNTSNFSIISTKNESIHSADEF